MDARNTHRAGRLRRWIPATALLLGLGLLAGLPAHADLCGSCPTPTAAQVAAQCPTLSLATRTHWLWGTNRDYLEFDGAECQYAVGTPVITMRNWRLVLKASGTAKNCPHCLSTATVTIIVSENESTAWALTASAGASVKALGMTLTSQIAAQLEQTSGLTRTTKGSQTFQPGYCRVIVWSAFLEAADPLATVTVNVSRSYAWWTKNESTGPTVHQRGTVTIPCGSASPTYTCKMPLAFHFHECQTGCPEPECSLIPTGEIGWQVPLPPGLAPPDGWEPRFPGKIFGDEDDDDTDEAPSSAGDQ